ncbi:MAG: single-stranded DNA-binding protein [Candidatus Sericytochromatia bacterium]|nr:single-stranded DNA-binding protein [Candidatus Sericytochromatia bacterium]
MGINHITLLGTISRAPEFRMTPDGVANLTFTVQVQRPARPDGTPGASDYIRVKAWRALAERLKDALHLDTLVVVEGRLTTRSYEAQDGQRRKVVEVEASNASPVGAAAPVAAPARPTAQEPDGPIYDDFADLEAAAPAPAAARPQGQRQAPPRPAAAPAPAPDFDDEIPF